jgi:hypothetical protein
MDAWHLNQIHLGKQTFREYEANGNGGRLLHERRSLAQIRDQLVPQYVISAVEPD